MVQATKNASQPPPGYWQREASHYPRPLTPLGADFIIEPINRAFRMVFETFGFPLEALEVREIGGYVYQRMKPLGAGDGASTKLPPKWVLWAVLRLHPAFRKRAARCKESLRARLDQQLVERWYAEWRPELSKEIERLRAVDLSQLSDKQLAAHIEELWRFGQHGFDVHFLLTITWFPMISLSFFCRDHLGYSDGGILPLLSGLSETSSEPAVEIAKLADKIKANAELTRAVLEAPASRVPEVLAERDSGLAAAFDAYIERYGCRALRYEVVEKTLGERPELVASLLQDELRKPGSITEERQRLKAAREEARANALAALEKAVLYRPPIDLGDEDAIEGATAPMRREFEGLLADAERAYPIREENEFYTVSVPLALARFGVLEAGRRLAVKGALASPDDVFLLRQEELVGALHGQPAAPDLIDERRSALRVAEAFDPPASYGTEPPMPSLDVFPPETKLAMETLLYATEKVFEPERSNRSEMPVARELKGIAAGRGTYSGPARVIMGEDEFDRLQPGDVLVCPITSPVWSILFSKVGALVTDTGGILSHPAIIAREYGIPAVVATGNATKVIPDGARVVVNGDSGIVELVG